MRSCGSLQGRHNDHDGVSNHQPHECLLNCLFRGRSKKTSKLHVTGLCVGNSPVTGEFPAQRASNAENVSIWWRHHIMTSLRVLPLLMLEADYSALFGQYHVYWCPGSSQDISRGDFDSIGYRQQCRLLHCEFGLLLLNKIKDMVPNVNATMYISSLIIFRAIQHAKSKLQNSSLLWLRCELQHKKIDIKHVR